MEHSHHSHHGHHHMNANDSISSSISTTAATLVQAVVTTMMNHAGGHDRHTSSDAAHAGHSVDLNIGSKDSSITDHSAHLHGSSGGADGAEHMKMYFHFGIDSIILFKEWTTSSTEGLVASVIGIFILALLYEGLKFFREHLFKRYFTSLEYSSVSVLGDDGKPVTEVHKVARSRIFSWPHLLQTYLHIIQMVLSYFLMLIFMTYNVWLCLAVVLGAGTGYFLFGWRKATVVDITEHCH